MMQEAEKQNIDIKRGLDVFIRYISEIFKENHMNKRTSKE